MVTTKISDELARLRIMREVALHEPTRATLLETPPEGVTRDQAAAAIDALWAAGTIEKWVDGAGQLASGSERLRMAGSGARRIAMLPLERKYRAEAIESAVRCAELTVEIMRAQQRGAISEMGELLRKVQAEAQVGREAARKADVEKQRGQS